MNYYNNIELQNNISVGDDRADGHGNGSSLSGVGEERFPPVEHALNDDTGEIGDGNPPTREARQPAEGASEPRGDFPYVSLDAPNEGGLLPRESTPSQGRSSNAAVLQAQVDQQWPPTPHVGHTPRRSREGTTRRSVRGLSSTLAQTTQPQDQPDPTLNRGDAEPQAEERTRPADPDQDPASQNGGQHTPSQDPPDDVEVDAEIQPRVRVRNVLLPQPTDGEIANAKKTRAYLKVGTLNIRGKSSPKQPDKWAYVWRAMASNHIGVMAVQETHLTPEETDALNLKYDGRMLVINTIDPDHPNSKGVALAINTKKPGKIDVRHDNLVDGRAIYAEIPWHNRKIRILGIYAPNMHSENEAFWKLLCDKLDSGDLPRVHIMLGDFNLVEDSIDRSPNDNDPKGAKSALMELKSRMLLQDGWRATFPDTLNYTYWQQATDARSRIDRIYVASKFTTSTGSRDWAIASSGVDTDHKMATAVLLDGDLPFLGPGRWAMQVHQLQDKALVRSFIHRGAEFENRMRDIRRMGRDSRQNAQKEFKSMTDDFIHLAQVHAKKQIPGPLQKIKKLEVELRITLNDKSLTTAERKLSGAIIQTRINELWTMVQKSARASNAAKVHIEYETTGKIWCALGKEKTPRDTILELRSPNAEQQTPAKKSEDMAELAKNYHERLQETNLLDDQAAWKDRTRNVLENVTAMMADRDNGSLSKLLTEDDVKGALRSLPNGKAAGINGLPTELWKTLQIHYDERKEQVADTPTFDVIHALTELYNDIEKFGTEQDCDFARGWMCPLYKKNDRTDIANYRPITLLNSEYKIFTKALTVKLAAAAPSLIHKDQAGFVQGRSIFDQVKLSQLMVNYCEATEDNNGAIVALDQEKAYDKILHPYLWETMEKFQIPQRFINTVKALYANAETVVIINGVASAPFKVVRGVRQGDPLSCLLFDLAIEPLACMLRNSDLRGMRIPGVTEKIITTLFADDTTVYLSKHDSFASLQAILDEWCSVSGAKFNIPKTEIIPVGSPEYRASVLESRGIAEQELPIANNIHILKDGEAARILGGWVGNQIKHDAPWARVVEKIEASLERWNRTYPTMEGRRLIIQMIIGGMTQYLTKIQGMPAEIETHLTKVIRTFMWNGESIPSIALDTLMAPIPEGGLNLLNLRARNEAIELTNVGEYCRFGERNRPTWAYVADELIRMNVPKKYHKGSNAAALKQPFIQSWTPKMNAGKTTLPKPLVRMLRTGKKHNVTFDMLMASSEVRRALPAWFHIGADRRMKHHTNTKIAQCLRINHGVRTVGDLENVSLSRTDADHVVQRYPNSTKLMPCGCDDCEADRAHGCDDPHTCLKRARRILEHILPKWHPATAENSDDLDLTQADKERNNEARTNKTPITFNPDTTCKGPLSQGIRVFSDPKAKINYPPFRQRGDAGNTQEVTAYTDGSCIHNGDENAQAGSGIWFGHEDARNKSIRVPQDMPQTNQTGEVLAIWYAATSTPLSAPLHIKSDSLYAIDGLTEHLGSWEGKGWIGIANAALFQATAAALRRRAATTTFQWIKGHSGIEGNEGADRLAKVGAEMDPDPLLRDKIRTPPRFNLTGAKLTCATQALLTKGIKSKLKRSPRTATTVNLDIARWATHDHLKAGLPTDARMFQAIRSRNLTKKERIFLYRVMHNGYKIGKYWNNIPGYEQRGLCSVCNGEEESMRHILEECLAPEREQIWSLAKQLWEKKGLEWPTITIGTVLASGLANFKTDLERRRPGANRLFQILLTNSAHLIWVLRCDRRINREDDEEFTNEEVHNRWVARMNARLDLDRRITDKRKFGKKATRPATVLQTWGGVLYDEKNLPEDWTRQSGVLVGIPVWKPGRNR